MSGFDNDVVYGVNVDFTGGSPVTGQMTMNGQLLIGSAVAPFIRANTLTAGVGIAITNGAGTITITNTGGGGGGGGANSLAGNVGSAPNIGGVIDVIGSSGITTTGDGIQTLTITPTGNLLTLAGLAGTGYLVQTGPGTFAERTFVAGSGISLTNPDGVAGATTITASPAVPTTFTEDAGTATPALNNINILGTATQGISTSGAGSTVTLTNADATALQKGVAKFDSTNFTVAAGNVTSNNITVTAGTGLTTGGTVTLGGSVTLALAVPVTVPHGGTGQTTLTNHGVVLGQGASAVAVTAAGTNGQVLIGATGADPAFATIAGTQGVTFTTGANSLSIGLSAVPNSALANSSITLVGGSGVTVTGSPVSLGGSATISVSGTLATQFSTDSGVATPSLNNLNILGTAAQGISTSGSGSTVTLTIANATTTTKGVASFNSANFTVTAGVVSLNSTSALETITPNSGGAVSQVSGNINDQGLAANTGGNAFPLFSYNGGAGQVNWENRTYLTPYVVDASTTNGSKGTFTTIAGAIAQAVADSYQGDIFIRAGTYTENLTLSPGINLVAFGGDGLTPTVTIKGKCTYTGTGTVTISNIRLQTNLDYFLAVTGLSASVVYLANCYLNCTNNTGINYTSSSASSQINIHNCRGDIGTTGITLYTSSASGQLELTYSYFTNSGATTTQSSNSAGQVTIRWSYSEIPFITSSTGRFYFRNSRCFSQNTNSTCITYNSSTDHAEIINSSLSSGSAVAVSVGAAATLKIVLTSIDSSTSNPITGTGTIQFSLITFLGTGDGINSSAIQTSLSMGPTIKFTGGPQITSGSGSPNGNIIAPKGSLYLRSDGTTTNNRAYINTNGGSTWTAITTVA